MVGFVSSVYLLQMNSMKSPFKSTGHGNEFWKPEKGIFLSYNPDVSRNPTAVICDSIIDLVEGPREVSTEETALEYDERWYNLDGDFRSELQKAYKKNGKEGVFSVFVENWCDHPNSTGEKDDLIPSDE